MRDVSDRDTLQLVAHTKVDIDHELGPEQLPYMQTAHNAHNEHSGQTSHNGTMNDATSLTHSMSGTDDYVHVIPLTHTVPLQRSQDKTLAKSIELFRTSLRNLSKYVKDGLQVSQLAIIEEADKDSRGNTF